MTGEVEKHGLARELVIYSALNILPVAVMVLVILFYSLTTGVYVLVIVAVFAALATVRLGLFIRLDGLGWFTAFALLIAGYLGSIAYMLHRANQYNRHPPELHEESEPQYYTPRDESLELDWTQPRGHGLGD
jgi:hypothetical protein